MTDIGIDSRIFRRESTKKDGTKGLFESVLGIAVRVSNYNAFKKNYMSAIKKAFENAGVSQDYQYYCTHDLMNFSLLQKNMIIETFAREISSSVDKIHVLYTLFSPSRIPEVKVYGRLAKREKLKLSKSTRTYSDIINSHFVQCFPAICAWRLHKYFSSYSTNFHLDSFQGHLFEGYEELSGFNKIVYPAGDCANPIISTADLLLDLVDKRLLDNRKFLLFDNIRPALSEFGDKVVVYPLLNKHLPKITPLDVLPLDTNILLKHPIFWVFKGSDMLNSEVFKDSKIFRNLVDYASASESVVKLFNRNTDIEHVKNGDVGVFLNDMGKELVSSYIKMGKKLKPMNMDLMLPKDIKIY